jgi:uncharacterized protein YndB with AHSA1/START domain
VPLQLRALVDVQAAPAHVFEVICTPERLPEWNVSVAEARRVTPDAPLGPGARAIMRGKLLGQTLESETEVTEFEPPRLFATRVVRGPSLVTRFELEPLEPTTSESGEVTGAGTRVQVEVQGEVPGGALGARLAEGFIRRELTASLDRLRVLAEQPAS